MKAIYDYIIEINERFKDHIILSNETKLYVDKRFTYDRNANVLHKVKESPIIKKFNIEQGTEVIIDPIIMHEYMGWEGEKRISANQITNEKNLFKISQRNIYFFKENNKLYSPNNYVLTKKIEKKQIKSSLLIIPNEVNSNQFEQYKVKIVSNSLYNENLIENTIGNTNINLGVPFWINEEEFLLFKEHHFFAIN